MGCRIAEQWKGECEIAWYCDGMCKTYYQPKSPPSDSESLQLWSFWSVGLTQLYWSCSKHPHCYLCIWHLCSHKTVQVKAAREAAWTGDSAEGWDSNSAKDLKERPCQTVKEKAIVMTFPISDVSSVGWKLLHFLLYYFTSFLCMYCVVGQFWPAASVCGVTYKWISVYSPGQLWEFVCRPCFCVHAGLNGRWPKLHHPCRDQC